MKTPEPMVGFPPGLLGAQPLRLRVVHHEDGLLALEKPPGVLIEPDPFWPEVPDIVSGLRQQAAQGKPELAAYALDKPRAVYDLDPDIAGLALIGTHADAATRLRDAYGSRLWQFTFRLLAEETEDAREHGHAFTCDLPLLRDREGLPRMQVSHRHGKKSATAFSREATLPGGLSLWRAQTDYPRLLQVRTHAMERGLRIVGDAPHQGRPPLTAGDINPRLRGAGREKVYYAPPCLWLAQVDTGRATLQAPLPHGLTVLLKKLQAGEMSA